MSRINLLAGNSLQSDRFHQLAQRGRRYSLTETGQSRQQHVQVSRSPGGTPNSLQPFAAFPGAPVRQLVAE